MGKIYRWIDIFYIFVICSSNIIVFGQIVFPGEEEEVAILRTLNFEPEIRNRFNNNPFSPCPISRHPSGQCLPYNQCPELKTLVGRHGLSSPMIRLLKERLCAVSRTSFRLCCATKEVNFENPIISTTPSNVPVFFEPPISRPRNPAGNQNLIPSESECGYATLTTRIIAGEKFAHGDQPWLVGLGTLSSTGKFEIQCGGALITKRHVLTAAHCFLVKSGIPSISHVILGEHHLSQDIEKEPPVILRIIRKLSPGYNKRSHINDLEMLELEKDVQFTGFIRPVCLPFGFENEEFIGEHMTIIGWGDTFFRSMEGSDVPLKATVSIIPRQQCNKAYERSSFINIRKEQICASSFKRDACQGDSGGPFIFEGRRSYLVGVVSFGVDCAGGVFPGVYTFIPYYLRWIQDNL